MAEGNGPHDVSERLARLVGRLDETVAVGECPTCGRNNWDYGQTTLALPRIAPNPTGQALEVLPLMCTHCGYVRLHSAEHLENPREDH